MRRETDAGEVDALILDAAQRQALVAVRELGGAGVRVCAVECHAGAPAWASRRCAASALVPDFTRRPDAFVDALLRLCEERRPRVLIPSHDGSIQALRDRRAELERTVGVALASEGALAVAVDKRRTLQAARDLGVRVPRGVVVGELGEVREALSEVGLPAVVKPARSWAQERGGGRRLNAVAATSATAVHQAAAAVLEEGVEVVLQEWLGGSREAVSLMYADGTVWARFAQRTTRSVPPLGGSSVRRESIPLPPDIAADAERLVSALELEGYSEAEFRRDAHGRPALMEVNPRLSASVEVAVRAGVPFPRLLYAWAAGEPMWEQLRYRSGVRMRWLGGDLSWLKKVLADPTQPDAPPAARAVGAFLADCVRPLSYDYLDPRDPRPALVATTGALRKLRRHTPPDTDVAVIGAGPYGLSISSHLSAARVAHEILGEPMDTWRNHMPREMCLKSEGFASNLSDPRGECTLARFCAEEGLEYGDVGVPVKLDTFERYGSRFQARFVAGLRRARVERVLGAAAGFELRLDSGETLRARRVIVATGVQGCAHLPPELGGAREGAVTHAFEQREPARWRGMRVAVVGAGQSALEGAALLHEQGAEVLLVARAPRIVWNADPTPGRRPLWARLRYPSSGLGEGLKMRLYASHPLLVHAAPAGKRLGVAYTALGPAGAWWLRDRFDGRVRTLLSRTVRAVEMEGEEEEERGEGLLHLRLGGPDSEERLAVHRVLAGTGYRPDVDRLRFLDAALRARIATAAGTPVLDRSFQSSVGGLYFVGYAAAGSFGPVMRFVYGADFTARRLARVLA
ncbi:MAG TPA: FAD-dependent oxidoreductase [Solirubrobacteraceae bacterium]|jgi:predicted ATP-grasp superfamily ATP-dependent carboligase|nr:FAD-dependent oxidoreductase [Solirubrobacteraceae bacterium]